jgi:hypothetical protein
MKSAYGLDQLIELAHAFLVLSDGIGYEQIPLTPTTRLSDNQQSAKRAELRRTSRNLS